LTHPWSVGAREPKQKGDIMYGLVNKTLEDMVRSRYGDASWDAINRKAGVDVDASISMDAYPDDVTYKLVGAPSEVLASMAGP
jgi:hypothetical protein